MGSKKLKINIQRKINCFLFNAYYLCIILAYENLYPWFYENYIQLYFNASKPLNFSDEKEVWLDFYGGWTEPRKILECMEYDIDYFNNVNIITFVEESINRNNYIYTYCDEYYIKSLNREDHFVHDILIFGYDSINRVLSVVGFDLNHNFIKYHIDYEEFEQAFLSGVELGKGYGHFFHAMKITPKFSNSYKYSFNTGYFLDNLNDYLQSKNSYLRENRSTPLPKFYKLTDNIFGVGIYTELIKYINKIVEDKESEIDYRPFHTLYEHKVSIYDSISYIYKVYNIDEKNILREYEQVKHKFNYIRMLIIKYNISKSDKILYKVSSLISHYKDVEIDILNEFCIKLSKIKKETIAK
jgi:hypothetical protein